MSITGRLTLPTDVDMVEETIRLKELLGADALRDCDGTTFPDALLSQDAKKYATYYTTRKDNEWAEANPDEVQQEYLISDRVTARGETLRIELMKGFHREQLKVNTIHDPKRWWEVVDRTTGEVVPTDKWEYDEASGEVEIQTVPYHEYTVSFLAFLIWDPVHMFNFITNDWKDAPHQITFDVRLPKTQQHVKEKLKQWCEEHPEINVVRFTTFFHQFTLTFDDQKREKYVDWFGYSASVSPYILEQFEEWAGYKFRPEFIVDEGYHNSIFRVPSKEFRDYVEFQQIEVSKLAKEIVDIVHSYGKEAMMFVGDHWIGTEPFGKYFANIGLDAVVGSVGDGVTMRMVSDIKGVDYTEGRLLPYFFPDVFCEGGDPIKEAKENWLKVRRAILRSPLDRIGYGGYLKLAAQWDGFVDAIQYVVGEFRHIHENMQGKSAYTAPFKVAVLSCWGALRGWMSNQVHHSIWHREIYSYTGVLECLSGMPFDVKFISFDEVIENPAVLDDCKVLVNVGDAYTAPSGGSYWKNPALSCAIKAFVAKGGGLIGVGEPSACQHQGHYFALASVLGVDKEVGFSLSTDKYNWNEQPHFITEDRPAHIDFGEGMKNVYAMPDTTIIKTEGQDVQLAAHTFGEGRSVYISGIPYSFENARLFYRAIFWAAGEEDRMKLWYSENDNIEVNYYPATGKYCVVNNTYEPQDTVIYDGRGKDTDMHLEPNGIYWFDFDGQE